MKRVWKWIGIIIGLLLTAGLIFVAVLQFTEYNPKETEAAEVARNTDRLVKTGEPIKLMTFNIGYGALGAEQDFFMDGGKTVRPSSKDVVETYLDGIQTIMTEADPDILFIQEIDRDSKRSYYIDEKKYFSDSWNGSSVFATNFKCLYVPYPLPTIGKAWAGVMTLNKFQISEAERIALPVSFSWPVRLCNLKRCLLVERLPVEGSSRELVLVNLHLEAYDDGSGKAAQTEILMNLLQEEAAKGNYVIAGGDFNQSFSTTDLSAYPLVDDSYFQAGIIDAGELPEGFAFHADSSVPSARLLNRPYQQSAEGNQYYIIDGFIVSEGISVLGLETLDKSFEFSDHNPVCIDFILENE